MTDPYYARGGVVLLHGDVHDLSPSLTKPGVVILDPPYSAHVHKHVRSASSARSGGAIDKQIDLGFEAISSRTRHHLAREAARLAGRWILVFSDAELAWLWRLGLVAAGAEYVRTGAWVKLASTPQFSGDRPSTGHEEITICHASRRVRLKRGGERRSPLAKRWNGGGGPALWSHGTVNRSSENDPRLHPTQKPIGLMIELVELFSSPGDIIYDLMCGSGTTAIAALRARGKEPGARKFVGIERNERYAETAARRIDAELDGVTMAHHVAGQVGLFSLAK